MKPSNDAAEEFQEKEPPGGCWWGGVKEVQGTGQCFQTPRWYAREALTLWNLHGAGMGKAVSCI